ncbi:hypothetical protein D3C80_1152280 [compost metagenome]
MFKARRLQRKPVERGCALIGGRLAGTGHPAQLFGFDAGQAVAIKGSLHVRLDPREENIKTGLLTVDAIDQRLAHIIAKVAFGKTNRAQRALLPRQLFALHQAI